MILFQSHCIIVLSAAFLISEVLADSTQSPCKASELHSGQCLSAMRALLASEDRYWFGLNYSRTCIPPANYSLSTCINVAPQRLSIVTRMRGSNDSSVDVIQQVLNVTFDVPSGSYQSCGNTYRVEAVTQTIDPTERTFISLWSANHRPKVTWRSEVNKLYTLIVWDAGSFFMHGIMYNINGSSADNGQTAWNYRGPKNPSSRDQPYVFLLYEQRGELTDASIWDILIVERRSSNNLSPKPFVAGLNLTGPIGASVLTVKVDSYSVGYMKTNRIVNNCPAMLTTKFSALPLSYDVSGVRLMTSVDVTFMSPEISVRSCCREVTVVSNVRMTNPMGDGHIGPVYTRFRPHVTLVPSNFFDTFYFLRIHFTLLLLDVTEELSGTPNTTTNTLLHWQIINIREGDVMSGETTLPYKAPLPLTVGGSGGRVFLFLLLKQSSMIHDTSGLIRFTGRDACPSHLKNRCHFNITAFITEHQMMIEGSSWFLTSPDNYSRQQVMTQGLQQKNAACSDVSGYSDPCPSVRCTGGSEVVAHASFVLVVLTSALHLLVVSHNVAIL
ncbi:hypothetical protein ACOMHN_007722 [Nucella lapillus]